MDASTYPPGKARRQAESSRTSATDKAEPGRPQPRFLGPPRRWSALLLLKGDAGAFAAIAIGCAPDDCRSQDGGTGRRLLVRTGRLGSALRPRAMASRGTAMRFVSARERGTMEAERLMSVRAVVVVWSLALLAAAGSVAIILASDRRWSPSTIALEVLVGLAFVSSGLVARVRRPENRTGSLMILVGLSWFGGALQASDASLPYTLGYASGTLIAAILIHLMLAFPSGRLLTRGERWVTAAMYAVALVLQPVWMLFDDLHGLKCDGCPRNALLIEHVEPLAVGLGIVTLTAVLVILVAVLVILMRRWRAASAPSRRVLAPVYLASGVAVGFVAIRTALDPFTEVGVGVLEWLSVLALLTVPLAFLAGLLRSRLARSAVATLVVELGETPAPGGLREALARALGDPSLELAYWLRDDTFVDADGHAVSLPAAGSGRVATKVERSGLPVAALIHDESLSDHPELVDGVVAAAGLALENERLQAQLRARLEDLRASRARRRGDRRRRAAAARAQPPRRRAAAARGALAFARSRRAGLRGRQGDLRGARAVALGARGRARRAARARARHPSRGAHRARPRPGARRAGRPRARAGRRP